MEGIRPAFPPRFEGPEFFNRMPFDDHHPRHRRHDDRRRFPRDENAPGDTPERNIERGPERNPERGPDRNPERGSDRNSERGSDRNSERGSDRNSEKGSERSAEKGGTERNSERSERNDKPDRRSRWSAGSPTRTEEVKQDTEMIVDTENMQTDENKCENNSENRQEENRSEEHQDMKEEKKHEKIELAPPGSTTPCRDEPEQPPRPAPNPEVKEAPVEQTPVQEQSVTNTEAEVKTTEESLDSGV